MPLKYVVSTSRRARSEGQAILESGLVLLIFCSFIIGTLDFAQFLYFHQSLVERVRVAARYAGTHPTDTAGIKNVAVYNTTSPDASNTPLLRNLTTDVVDVERVDAPAPDGHVTVSVSRYRFDFFSPLITSTATARTISATAVTE
jgi:Flp pilus assembly protein TadG